MADAYIIDAVRTPRGIGKPGKGALSHLHPQHLAATVLKAIKERNNLDTATVDDIDLVHLHPEGQAGRRSGPHGSAGRRL
jgi:acetyl-CoA C-acetyltransferase